MAKQRVKGKLPRGQTYGASFDTKDEAMVAADDLKKQGATEITIQLESDNKS